MNFIENEILDVANTFIPLSSSHTQTLDSNKNGRPETSDDELSDSGARTRESGSNETKSTKTTFVSKEM